MQALVKITELEDAINAFKRANPDGSPAFPSAMTMLATLYGTLIYQRVDRFDFDQQTPACQRLLKEWMGTGNIDRPTIPADNEPAILRARESG